MLKFIRGKGHQPSAERIRLQKELFAFNKTAHHGFPNRPSALAWDPKLCIMAIGTRSGAIKVYGQPGVEVYGQHKVDSSVSQIFFLPNQGRLVSLCDDNSLHLWEINSSNGKSTMEEKKSCSLEGRLKKISTCCLQSSGKHLLIGTEGGNIYLLDVTSFEMTDHIIYQDVVMQNVPDDYKVNPGAVESIAEHPKDPEKILIGYNRGLLVLWDNKTLNADHTYTGTQQLESVSWHRQGSLFLSSHNDGSYVTWSASDPSKPNDAPNTPYGPFPCKAINKIFWRTTKGDDFVIFGGGMPRATFGDRYTVTIQKGSQHVVLDFTSRVVDFFTISDADEEYEYDDPHALVVLAEEELVVVDLHSEGWPTFHAPYLVSLHSSAVTFTQHYSGIPEDIWNKIVATGDRQTSGQYSTREWPVNGGRLTVHEQTSRDLLLTGHEDGTVRFWDASGVALIPLYKLSTAALFTGEEIAAEPSDADEVEEWPPFRKVGVFDPYSDDPRLAIRKILLCPVSGTLVVAGTAGQVIVMNFSDAEAEVELSSLTLNIVSDRDNFAWKGHSQLTLKPDNVKFGAGFHPHVVVQLHPPAAITAVALHSEWGLIAAGTAHGFGLCDYSRKVSIMSKCTLNPNDLTGMGDTTMSRRKSFKKSLRESFRRLRRGRSQRNTRKSPQRSPSEEREGGKTPPVANTEVSTEPLHASSPSPTNIDAKPIERQVEARAVDDSMGSMVRCLYLAQSYIVSMASTTPTLWAGTNSGAIFVFTVVVPPKEKRAETNVLCNLGKEIQLKHRAPVVSITIVDSANCPLPEPFERAKFPESPGIHRVVICSEEQFKVFSLPSLKPYCKFKLTAHEGARVRRIGFGNFRSKSDDKYSENCLMCLSNLGDLSVFSVPDLRRQLNVNCIKREDINGISSLVFTRYGQTFHLHSSSEFQRCSLSARNITEPRCVFDLPDGVRPVVENNENNPVIAHNENIPMINGEAELDDAPGEDLGFSKMKAGSLDLQEGNGNEEDRKDDSTGDITIDSVKDHLTLTSSDEVHVRVTERREEKTEVKREESVITVETTILTSETTATSMITEAPSTSPLESERTGLSCCPPTETKVMTAPIAKIEELLAAEAEFPLGTSR